MFEIPSSNFESFESSPTNFVKLFDSFELPEANFKPQTSGSSTAIESFTLMYIQTFLNNDFSCQN
jgi:hypothetical protein